MNCNLFLILLFFGNSSANLIDSLRKDFIVPLENYVKSEPSRIAHCIISIFTYAIFRGEDPNINYLLYTPDNLKDPCDLQPTEKSLQKCKFNPKLKTKVLIHGWIKDLPPSDLKYVMKDKILQSGDYNVVIHNWTAYTQETANSVGYVKSAQLSFYVGVKISSWIKFLQKTTGVHPNSFHLIPHSLGANVASYTGKTTCHLGRITFLDPAAPGFRLIPKYFRSYEGDAEYVDAIHTSASVNDSSGDTYVRPIAHVDHYPNGGNHQPKCFYGATFQRVTGENVTVNSSSTEVSCNHYSVYDYYLESILKDCHFVGRICKSYEKYIKGECNDSPTCDMGFYSSERPDLPVYSKCYFNTSSYPPYCQN